MPVYDADGKLLTSGGGGGVTSLDDLSDAAITTPSAGDGLFYDGTNFVNQPFISEGKVDILYGGTGADFDATGPGEVIQAGNGTVLSIRPHNMGAITAPTANDDNTQGYVVGSLWVDTVAERSYRCMNASTGAAVWEPRGEDANAIHDNASGEINALTEKVSPVSGDLIIIEDSAASNAKKKVQIGNLPTSGGASALDDLSDVAITTAAPGDVLMRNATQFVNTNIAEQRVVGRLTGEDVKGLTAAEVSTLLSLSTTYVQLSLFDANTILAATTDNTPAAVTIAEQTVLGRATGGNIAALAIDSDLSSVSANDDTVPSAKATKAALDGKAASSHVHAASDITSGALALARGGSNADLSSTGPGDVVQASAGAALTIRKSNLTATTAPTVNDDNTQGYVVGSLWVNTVTAKAYRCTKADTGAADWPQMGLDSDAIHKGTSAEISALTEKATPVSADLLIIEDSAASNAKKKVQVGNLPSGGASAPTGAMLMWLTDTAPTDWLLCYGQAVSRTTYAALFAVISTTYGVGDGSTTFNLPDLRGRLPLGQDDMGGSSANRVTAAAADTLGGAGGAETHTLTVAEMPAHTHGLPARSNTVVNSGSNDVLVAGYPNTVTSGSAGGGNAHNNMPPYITVNYIIKT